MSWVAWVVFTRCLSSLWSCLLLLVPCCFRSASLLVGAVPKPDILFKVSPQQRITAYAVWVRLSGCRGKFWTSDRCSCRNFGTRIITVMLLLSLSVPQLFQVPYVVMNRSQFCAPRRVCPCSGTSGRLVCDVAASSEPAVAAGCAERGLCYSSPQIWFPLFLPNASLPRPVGVRTTETVMSAFGLSASSTGNVDISILRS